jgi:hypothetical protein
MIIPIDKTLFDIHQAYSKHVVPATATEYHQLDTRGVHSRLAQCTCGAWHWRDKGCPDELLYGRLAGNFLYNNPCLRDSLYTWFTRGYVDQVSTSSQIATWEAVVKTAAYCQQKAEDHDPN